MTGPYDTEQEARAGAHRVVAREPGRSILTPGGNHELLARALADAGVELGDYDRRILSWMAGWSDAVCAVVAGWIARAARERKERPSAPVSPLMLTPRDRRSVLAAIAEAAEAREARASAWCDQCREAAAGMCDEHADDIDQAEAYRALARRIGGSS